ncbi:hypothetical protein Acr_23g0011010 [Actinidia rufa]|uniref:Uncharacterized protein n=1 Tax=Actinidia rufa TaxID=165716 RepID=A0A7J0GPG9_9ERIC|nr:hypothetical protein Acr_23g0011010 [Actinidia rufa]
MPEGFKIGLAPDGNICCLAQDMGTQLGASNTNHRVYTPGEEEAMFQNLGHLAGLLTQKARELGEGEDHLAGMT